VILLAVDVGQLVEVFWVSVLAGVGITTAFSFVVLGTSGWAQCRRDGRGGASAIYLSVAAVAMLIFVGGVVFGVHIMLSKS
jgi:hypothetical protein